jgi:CPA2 family monovalent cation:H+ antiporter-2
MIISISLALMIAGILLVILNRTDIPEIPIYLGSGLLLSLLVSLAQSRGIVSHEFIEAEIMREIALLGLSILIFYNTSGMLLDPKRSTAIDSFKTSLWMSIVSFAGITGLSLYFGFNSLESLLFGVTGSVGSTLLDSGLVKEEARKNHIYGWITEDIDFYDDLFGIVVLTLILASVGGIVPFTGLLVSLVLILSALVLRDYFSRIIMKITGGENELVLLSGIATLISIVWITESTGVSALAGIYAAGLMLVNTELGFRVRERFTAVKDFFTALSFISIGYLLTLPGMRYIGAVTGLVLFASVIRPLFSTQVLRLQGYDLRTSFMAVFSDIGDSCSRGFVACSSN